MTDSETPTTNDRITSFEPFLTSSFTRTGGKRIAVLSAISINSTMNFFYDAPGLRATAATLVEMAVKLEPPKKEWAVQDAGDGKMMATFGDKLTATNVRVMFAEEIGASKKPAHKRTKSRTAKKSARKAKR